MRYLLPLLLVLVLALPAEAKFHPIKFVRRAVALTVGVVAFPIAAPLNYGIQTVSAEYYMTHGNYKAATIMIDGRLYDWLWLEKY